IKEVGGGQILILKYLPQFGLFAYLITLTKNGRNKRMLEFKKLWIALAVVTIGSFIVLGYYGFEIYREAPPIPEQVVDTEGNLLFTGENIKNGQNVWQSLGGHSVGTVWGHGAYIAPDWSADWLHREAVFMLDEM